MRQGWCRYRAEFLRVGGDGVRRYEWWCDCDCEHLRGIQVVEVTPEVVKELFRGFQGLQRRNRRGHGQFPGLVRWGGVGWGEGGDY